MSYKLRYMNKKFGLLVVGILVVMSSCMPITGVALTSEDQQFASWASRTSKTLSADCGSIGRAAERFDLDSLAMSGKWLYDDANKALSEIDRYHVSSVLKPVKSEFKLGLEDCKRAGYYYNRGARNINADDLEKANNYAKSATRHIKKATALLPT